MFLAVYNFNTTQVLSLYPNYSPTLLQHYMNFHVRAEPLRLPHGCACSSGWSQAQETALSAARSPMPGPQCDPCTATKHPANQTPASAPNEVGPTRKGRAACTLVQHMWRAGALRTRRQQHLAAHDGIPVQQVTPARAISTPCPAPHPVWPSGALKAVADFPAVNCNCSLPDALLLPGKWLQVTCLMLSMPTLPHVLLDHHGKHKPCFCSQTAAC